jgi:hypothetical protein
MRIKAMRSLVSSQEGFTMMLALGVMLVASLLMVAAFTAANGDVHLSHQDSIQKQAYYASLAGVQEFEYQMQTNPNYWETCGAPTNTLPQETSARYEVTILPASTAPGGTTACLTTNPFKTAIESSGSNANTFRVESVGCAGKTGLVNCKEPLAKGVSKHTIVATFKVTGFLNYVYYTNHEIEDPALYEAPKVCNEGKYYPATASCQIIQFATGDAVKGPMHTNDAVCVGGSATFGRSGHVPSDVVEFYLGRNASCNGTPTYNTTTKTYAKGELLEPPESDTSLSTYATEENEFTGVTHLVLNGSTNEIEVTNAAFHGGVTTKIPWPTNGLIWIHSVEKEGEEACGYNFEPHSADNLEETTNETSCGNVYVKGTYSKALTIGSGKDLIINGNLSPTGVTVGNEPTGTATLGLIANNNVRIYHPVAETYAAHGAGNNECNSGKDTYIGSSKCEYQNEGAGCDAPNAAGSQTNPWIYAAILSTTHSFVVDNYNCGAKLEELHIYGAIAQNYRGIVGTSGGTGYLKDYRYDDRLAVDEPPYFLAPLKAGWKVSRETAPTAG